jgi:hypothetical protein
MNKHAMNPALRTTPWLVFAVLVFFLAVKSVSAADSKSTYLQCLTNFESYAESIWTTATSTNQPPDSGFWGDGGSAGNGGIRGNCGIAVGYATLVIAQPGNARNTTRLARIRQALNYAANAHVTGAYTCVDGNKWGWSSGSSTDWQTPLWSGSLGLACVLVQGQLPAQTVTDVKRVVASEATHRAGIAPGSGYIGDTKAEENGWDSNILSLGAAWLSTDPSAPSWLTAAKKYLANTYTVANTNGDPLASWITTTTLYPTFALENHGFYHPAYEMVAGMSMGDSYLMTRLANPTVATQLQAFAEHNVMNVWNNNLQYMVLDSGDFAYPAGLDWELHDFEQNSYIAWIASHFNDPIARWTDYQLAQQVRYRQLVNGDGRFVGPSGGGFYREAVEARRTAIAWLHWNNADFPTGPSNAPPPAVVHFPDVKIVAQRGPAGFFSISYGSRVMGMLEARAQSIPTNSFLASPLLPGMLGLGALGNPTSAQLIGFITNSSGFDAELKLINSGGTYTEVYVKSTGNTVGIVEVPWAGGNAQPTPASSFDIGIENDPLTGGSRLLEWTGGSATITNRSGAARVISNNWVCVSGNYGVCAGPSGYFNYAAASTYNRLGAAQDVLEFFPDQTLAARYAVYFPGQTASQTASNALRVSWSVANTTGVLSFPGPGGALVTLSAVVPGEQPTYLPYSVPALTVSASSNQGPYPPTNAYNGVLTDFWVSLYGPTNHAEWLKVQFPRLAAISGFKVYPRTDNGGYGPRDVQVFLNVTNAVPASGVPASGTNAYTGTMAPTTTLDIAFAQPLYASNALLVINSGYDRGATTGVRNTQVNEFMLLERAQPYTFGDWALRHFTSAQLADPSVSAYGADPEGDGVVNVVEFATGADPFAADAALSSVQSPKRSGSQFAFRFRERKQLGDFQRIFEGSTNLATWSAATPVSLTSVTDLGECDLLEVSFPLANAPAFYRLRYVRP